MTKIELAQRMERDAKAFYRRHTAGLKILDDDLNLLSTFGVFLWMEYVETELAAAQAEVERLTGVLRGIRDSDETNAVRLQNMAGVAIGKADEDQNE